MQTECVHQSLIGSLLLSSACNHCLLSRGHPEGMAAGRSRSVREETLAIR